MLYQVGPSKSGHTSSFPWSESSSNLGEKKNLKVFGTCGDAVLRPEWTVLLPERAAVIVDMGTLID